MQGPSTSDPTQRPDTVGTLLAAARKVGVARLDAQLLVAHRLGRPRAWVIAHDEQRLSCSEAAWLARALEERASGVPLAYLTGRREFHGLELEVNAAVLVPRPETEGLVDWALELVGNLHVQHRQGRVVDLGTGSGAIALAIKHAHPGLSLTAVDCSEAALCVARANAARLGLAIECVLGDWWQALPGRRFDIAVSNPPYVPAGDPHLVHLRDEPLLALSPGSDGLSALRAVVGSAGRHLEPGGWLLLEHGHDQAHSVCDMLRVAGFQDVGTRTDLAGLPRCSGGRWARDDGPRPTADVADGFAV